MRTVFSWTPGLAAGRMDHSARTTRTVQELLGRERGQFARLGVK
ncbi:hypothetical protein [Streptomyces fagopyri]|nr:hypothetical protein [Streptomyces fagopyri]